LLVYVTASWWNWYYGPSFGQRPFIEFYPINALLIALLFSSLRSRKHIKAFYGVTIVLVFLNLLQSFQYVKGIISPWDMNFEKYKYSFLRTSPKYYSSLGGCNDIVPYPGTKTLLREIKNDYEKKYIGWTESITKAVGAERKNVSDFTSLEFNSACDIVADSLMASYRLLYAEIALEKQEIVASGKLGPLLGIVISDKKNKYHYHTFPINEIPNKIVNRWQNFSYNVEIPKVKAPGDVIRIYIWNKNKQQFYLDNFKVRIYGIR
jgi:hypothetical protein